MRIPTLALGILLMPGIAVAQPTMAVWVDDGGALTNDYTVGPTIEFMVVVTLDSDGSQASGAAFNTSDVRAMPGVFVLGSVTPNGGCPSIIPEDCMGDDYLMAFTDCVEPGDRIQLVRIRLIDLAGMVPADAVITVSPYFEGIDGEPGFFDCSDTPIAAPMGGVPGGTTSSGVTWPDGALILNPTRPIPVSDPTFGALKSRY